MKNKSFDLMAVAGVCLLCTSVFAQHYYSRGKQIPLKTDQGKVRVKFDDQLTDSLRNELVSTLSVLGKELWEPARVDNFYSYDLNAGSTYDQVAADLRAREMVRFVEPYYTSENGEPLLTGITFCVGFNSDVTPEEIARINAENGVAIERQSEYLKSMYLLRITDSSKLGLLATANAY